MIIIEPYKEEYHQAVIALVTHIQQQEFTIAITYEDQPDLQNIKDFYGRGKGNFWVATDNDEVIGTIALIDIGDCAAVLRKMFVKDSYRGVEKPVALALLKNLENYCRKQHIAAIYLGTTDKFIAAHKFYEKNGYAEIAKTNLPSNFPVMQIDTKFYYKNL